MALFAYKWTRIISNFFNLLYMSVVFIISILCSTVGAASCDEEDEGDDTLNYNANVVSVTEKTSSTTEDNESSN